MKPALIVLFAALVALTAASASGAPATAISSRFTRIVESRCPEISQPGPADEVGDELGKRCPGLGANAIWIYYFDSSRMRLGFGRRGNINGMFGPERDEAWPFEWRGRVVAGRFTPFAVIARVRPAGDPGPTTELAVWKLTADGASCIIGHFGPGPRQNEQARAAADRALTGAACEAPPDLLD